MELVSEICVVIHNFLIRMYQSGAFEEDLAEEGAQTDIIN